MKQHENYRELIWTLAKTDFKLRYHGSVLGYFWAILKPLLMFLVLNFVFSAMFNPRNTGANYYSLQLIVAIMMFNFFSEGTSSGMASLLSKAQLVNKIYIPRWTIILASTVNAVLVYLMNLVVIISFFIWQKYIPSIEAIFLFLFFSVLIYIIILSFSLVTAPLYVKFRDLAMIWEVLITILFYGSPVIYPLSILPVYIQRTILVNPMAFIIHFVKEALTNNHFPDAWQIILFTFLLCVAFVFSIFLYKKLIKNVAENL